MSRSKKQNNNEYGIFAYEVKFANGAISKPLSISEILLEENHGSGRICRLIIHCKANDQPESASIELQFVDASVDEDSLDKTINYTIRANDKDWVFVTSSMIDERISKVKYSGFANKISQARPSSIIMFIIIPLFALTFWILVPSQRDWIANLDEMRNTSGDAVEFFYRVEKSRFERMKFFEYFPAILMLIMVLPFVVAMVCLFFSNMLPRYNFFWGDYMTFYNKRMSRLKFIFSGVLLVLALGVFGNYLYDTIF